MNISITIVYDSYPYNPSARISSGFACVIKTPESTILFDTGIHGPTLLYNLEQLGISPKEIDSIVISHIDSDHIGGLFKFLDEHRKVPVPVYVPRSFPVPFKDLITIHGANVVEVSTKRKQICPGVETTGEMGMWIKEQALMVKTERGTIVIVGDAHSGIVNVIQKVKRLTKDKILLILGGYSLGGASSGELQSITRMFSELGVEYVAPCHSSSDRARELFKTEYSNCYIESGVGRVITF